MIHQTFVAYWTICQKTNLRPVKSWTGQLAYSNFF